jgi:hypothetical protein
MMGKAKDYEAYSFIDLLKYNILLKKNNQELLATCKKVVKWLNRNAEACKKRSKTTEFVSLRKAEVADAKMYRAMAKDIQQTIDKQESDHE